MNMNTKNNNIHNDINNHDGPKQRRSPLNICLLQPPLRKLTETPLESTQAVIQLMQQAAATEHSSPKHNNNNDIDLMVLPELCPVGYLEDTFANYLPKTLELQEMYTKMDAMLQDAAKTTLQCAICYGTIGWKEKKKEGCHDDDNNNNNMLFFIRQKVVDASGVEIASYDKIHLCDYGDCAETRFFCKGTKEVSFSLQKNWKLGLMICADMRYPLLTRRLVSCRAHGVDAVLQPSCFSRDVSFRTWKSFRETRAVENGIYWAATNYAGSNYGNASLVPPWVDEDHEPQVLGTDTGYLIGQLEQEALEHARKELPFWKHVVSSSSCECCDENLSIASTACSSSSVNP